MKTQVLFLTVIFFILTAIANAQSWSLTGNSGTLVNTNFLGTVDGQPLELKVDNQKAAYIDYVLKSLANTSFGYQSLLNVSGGSGGNSSFGYQSLYKNTSGAYNSAGGQFSLYSNTTGSSNTAFGVRAIYKNITGNFNTAFGNRALTSNTSGSSNTAFGDGASNSNTTGILNVAIGSGSLYSNTATSECVAIGDSALYHLNIGNNSQLINVAVGSKALYNCSNGYANSALGYRTLYTNTNGLANTAIGYYALFSNTNGDTNTGIGYLALYSNQSGYSNTAIGNETLYYNTGKENTGNGASVLYNNISGYDNTGEGTNALYYNTTGYFNTAIGLNALAFTTASFNNTSIGAESGYLYNNGNDNTFLGAYSDANNNTYSNSTALGYDAIISASNQTRIGSSLTTSIGGYTNWTNVSDGRVKKNIKQNVPGLVFINKLQPITYNLDLDAVDIILQKQKRKDSTGKTIQLAPYEIDVRKAKEKIVYTGFIAQDVETAAKSLNYDFSGVDAAKNSKDLYGLRYSDFVVPLVKAVQELSSQNDSLKAVNNSQQIINVQLQSEIDELKTMIKLDQKNISQSTALSSASLEQNIPNPFRGSTIIGYTLPQQYSSAQIIIRDNNGNSLKAINVSGNGKGSLNVDASTIANGAYSYSLLIDGRLIDTKQMILAK